ncbi:putative amidohydrolase YhaA [Hyella patelloides LEGE 07179]|uniref:Putative amidohydrolase YhaA n=1 Tax=Hyella patelloides LEGE 07179 TaxID=945734 RepID=A0A563W495_9CYAN|nr:M20 family metallopeptidase [Hyella patelloides]VEP18519.1 putative amidohydrolase YhaA [Hyella patelloides LEGE 07179]
MVLTTNIANSINFSHIRPEIRDLQTQLVTWRRNIHQKPELGFQEHITAALVSQQLSAWSIPHQTSVAKTGVVAIIEGNQPGKVIAIRADMDALPIQEANEVSYRSQHDGKMHACGHDGHVAIALGTAYYLNQHKEKLSGTVKIIFQPAEEGPGGAKPMIEAGVLKNPDVDAIMGLHLWNNLPLGTIGVRSGALMAAVECFRLHIFGQGGHGAMPDQTIDSIVVGSQIVNALQTIVARNINPLDSAVVTVGEFHGGTALNVIADSVTMSGTVRYFNPQLESFIGERIESIVAGICQSHGATYKLDYWQLYPPTINHPEMAQLVASVANEVVETPLGVVPECQTMGGEDMSFFLQQVPGCYFFLGSANSDRGLAYPHHHPRFDFDETALGMGVEIFVRCVEKFLQNY